MCRPEVSVLFNEPKLLKCTHFETRIGSPKCFSALQRAEIAEMMRVDRVADQCGSFSALQRAEIAEIARRRAGARGSGRFQCSSTSRNC